MGNPVVWLGGWASGLACWRKAIEALYPGHEHAFLDSHAILEEPGLLAVAAAGLPPNGTLVAWSLGSLLLHQALTEGGLRAGCRMVSVSPIFDFCDANGPWPKAAVIRMSRRLRNEREAVLAEFFGLMKGASPLPEGAEAAWFKQARAYGPETLRKGLETLGAVALKRADLPPSDRHFFLSSPRDPLAPTPRGEFPGGAWMAYPRGHLPFLDLPGLLRPLLQSRPQSDGSRAAGAP